MTTLKTLAKVIASRAQAEGVGATVRRSIGTAQLRNLDPFLMLDEFTVAAPAGFPDHPHRGFETVTYMLSGAVEHEDFAGHRGNIGPGDLQWMTAGRGIVHAEMPFGKDPATGLQLWVNLPASAKSMEPRYQELLDKDVPRFVSSSGGVTVKVIAGETENVKAAVLTVTPIYYLDVRMAPGEAFSQSIPAGFNTFLYTLSGKLQVGQEKSVVDAHCTAVLSTDGDKVVIQTPQESDSHFVLIAGKPIGEPVVQHGPFVMTSQEEIYQAFMDYQMGSNGFERAVSWSSSIGQRR